MYSQIKILATTIVVAVVVLAGSFWLTPDAGKSESSVDIIILAGSSPCNPRVEVCES